jgi:hypothetical protein
MTTLALGINSAIKARQERLEKIQTVYKAAQSSSFEFPYALQKNNPQVNMINSPRAIAYTADNNLIIEYDRDHKLLRHQLYNGAIRGLSTVVKDVARDMVNLDADTSKNKAKLRFQETTFSRIIIDRDHNGIQAGDSIGRKKYEKGEATAEDETILSRRGEKTKTTSDEYLRLINCAYNYLQKK